MPIHDQDDANNIIIQTARHSIDLSIDLEHQLTYLESNPNTPADPHFARNSTPNASKRDSLDPHILASIVMQLRQSLEAMTKERDDLITVVATAHANEARLTDAMQLMTDKCTSMEGELAELRKKTKEDEDAITMLRSKVEESRRGLMRLQTESRRQSTILAPVDISRTSSTPLAAKRASFTPLTLSSTPSSFTPRKNAHRRISSVSDSGSLLGFELRSSPQSQNFSFNESDHNARQSVVFGRGSPPRIEHTLAPPESMSPEIESLRAEIKTLKSDLEDARAELNEAIEARDASDTCVKALREFITENNVGTPNQSANMKEYPIPALVPQGEPPKPTAAAQGWGFKLWNTKVASTTAPPPPPAPSAVVSPASTSTPDTASISRKIGGFFSSRASISSTNSAQLPSAPPLHQLDTSARVRDSSASDSSSMVDSLAEPISPSSKSGDANVPVLVRDLTSISLGDGPAPGQDHNIPAKTLQRDIDISTPPMTL